MDYWCILSALCLCLSNTQLTGQLRVTELPDVHGQVSVSLRELPGVLVRNRSQVTGQANESPLFQPYISPLRGPAGLGFLLVCRGQVLSFSRTAMSSRSKSHVASPRHCDSLSPGLWAWEEVGSLRSHLPHRGICRSSCGKGVRRGFSQPREL